MLERTLRTAFTGTFYFVKIVAMTSLITS